MHVLHSLTLPTFALWGRRVLRCADSGMLFVEARMELTLCKLLVLARRLEFCMLLDGGRQLVLARKLWLKAPRASMGAAASSFS
jgi:hypothetical protein